jgi:hypothetical protein
MAATTTTTTVSPRVYQALAIAKALEAYALYGLKVNRAYTPSAMMRTASSITGKRFAARDYTGAAAALKEWANEQSRN